MRCKQTFLSSLRVYTDMRKPDTPEYQVSEENINRADPKPLTGHK